MGQADEFFAVAEHVVRKVETEKLHQRHYSDVLDGEGNQYVDLVMEGGGVLGIAFAGYIYILEKAGLRFVGLGGSLGRLHHRAGIGRHRCAWTGQKRKTGADARQHPHGQLH